MDSVNDEYPEFNEEIFPVSDNESQDVTSTLKKDCVKNKQPL